METGNKRRILSWSRMPYGRIAIQTILLQTRFSFTLYRQLENYQSMSYKGHSKKTKLKQSVNKFFSSLCYAIKLPITANTCNVSIIESNLIDYRAFHGLVQNIFHQIKMLTSFEYQHENIQIISLELLHWVLLVLRMVISLKILQTCTFDFIEIRREK